MKRFWILAAFAATTLYAQTTTYTGTVKDLTGATVTSGRITFSLNAPSGGSIPGTGSFVATTVSCLINASGSPVSSSDGVSPCVITNNSALTPTGTSYTLCRQPYNVTPGSCFVTYANGGTVDISTLVPTPATQPSYGVAATNGNNTWTGTNAFNALTTTTLSATTATATALTASVNSVVNVTAPPYNATGNCTTDDHNAIQAAITAAATYNPPAVVYFPKASGGCYLTSTLTWNGASLEGQPTSGGGQNSSGVIIKGQPSQDILHVPDPTTTGGTGPSPGWTIEHLTFQVNDSVDASASFPHRKPGRTFNDAAMTASSAVLTSPNSVINCGDIGQHISIAGAGSSGSILTTTVLSVTPCYSQTGASGRTITLANAASTTVSSATGYITPANISLATTIGNCAIAFDNSDGYSSDWLMTPLSPPGLIANLGDTLHDVIFTSTSGATNGKNNSCGLFTQGTWGPYNLDARQVQVNRLYWGIAMVCSDVNSTYQSCSSDFQKWDHGNWNLDTFPWLSYNGGEGTMEDIEITALNGPQILGASNTFFDSPGLWYFRMPEFETASGIFGVPWRYDGSGSTFENTQFIPGPLAGNPLSGSITLDGGQNRCINCAGQGAWVFNGNSNIFDIGGNLDSITVTDNGQGNVIKGGKYSSPPGQKQPTRPIALNSFTWPYPYQTLTSDFLAFGQPSAYFNNLRDTMFLPQDFVASSCGNCAQVTDAASPIGIAYQWGNTATVAHFANAASFIIGQNIGAGKQRVYASMTCSSGTTWSLKIYANSVQVGSTINYTCNSSTYTGGVGTVDLTGLSGQVLSLQGSGPTTANVAYVGFVPYQGDYNGQQPVLASTALGVTGSGAAVTTGPTTSVNGDVTSFTGTAGQLQDSGVASSKIVQSTTTPTVNTAACIKTVGPPVVIGYCSTALTGTPPVCTCN